MLTMRTNLRTERDSDRDINSEDTAVITFDLQNVITCPRADVGDHFYKRKILFVLDHCWGPDYTTGGVFVVVATMTRRRRPQQ